MADSVQSTTRVFSADIKVEFKDEDDKMFNAEPYDQTIKQEIKNEDDMFDDGVTCNPTKTLVVPKVTKNDFMLARCGSKANGGKGCFRGTVVIEVPGGCCRITHCLWDTGADHSFISRKIVTESGLQTYKVKPARFALADERIAVHDEIVEIKTWVSGVVQTVTAYVDDSKTKMYILFGYDWYDAFACLQGRVGTPKRKSNVTVAQDEDGLRRYRYVVEEDPRGKRTTYTWMTRKEGLAWSASKRLMRTESKAKIANAKTDERLEKMKAKLMVAKAKASEREKKREARAKIARAKVDEKRRALGYLV